MVPSGPVISSDGFMSQIGAFPSVDGSSELESKVSVTVPSWSVHRWWPSFYTGLYWTLVWSGIMLHWLTTLVTLACTHTLDGFCTDWQQHKYSIDWVKPSDWPTVGLITPDWSVSPQILSRPFPPRRSEFFQLLFLVMCSEFPHTKQFV